MSSARRPQVRLLFDEDVSPKVARALRELGFNVEHVHGPGQPTKGATDAEVLDFALRTQQTVVTRNLDMVMLCGERGISVVWLDRQRGRRELTLDQQAAMAFAGIPDWCADLSTATGPVCVRVLSTRRHVLPVADAARIAEKRHLKIQRRQRPPRPKPSPEGQLLTDDVAS